QHGHRDRRQACGHAGADLRRGADRQRHADGQARVRREQWRFLAEVSPRNAVLYLGGGLVLLAAIGAIYLEILVQPRSTHEAWMVTQDVSAGTPFSAQNVRQVSIPETGDRIVGYGGNPIADHRRAGHALGSGHMLADDDLLQTDMVLVPVTFKAAPPLTH